MKQIKTVIEPINRVSRFDDKVNRLLEDGWKLTERKTVRTVGDISESFNIPDVMVLYAELEREKEWFEEVTI
nr:MAG TPA: protein of unknown function (DUF1737) [Caudoviricetes sp.]